jgi:hypothetical protein
LPLNGRNVLDLAYLQPGVAPANNPTLSTFGQGLGFRVNGGRGVENNVMLDGSNNNEIAVGGSTGAQPRPDALQEFRILSSNFDAEFGRNAGSIIQVVTKSGTNEYHGNARAFFRPTVLSARKYFDTARRRYERKEIGGNFGGPIKLPKLYNGKERTFFFVDYETRRQLIGDTRVVTGLPTKAELAGDFSKSGITLTDPATGLQFPGDVIPANRISPIAKYYLKFLDLNADATGSARVGADEITNVTYVTFRVDHQLARKNNLSFSSNINDTNILSPFAFGGASVPGFASSDKRRTVNYILRDTHFINNNLSNYLLLGYARNNQPSVAPINPDTPASIGFTANFVVEPAFAGPPRIDLYERGIVMGNSIQGPQARVTENFQIQDGVSWIHGKHSFKFGFDGTKYRGDQLFLFINQGAMGFSGLDSPNTTGDDLADFMIGNTPQDVQFGSNGLRDFRQHMASLFAQDTWKLNKKLTLTLGLRWEYSSPITDKFDRMAYYRLGVTSQLLASGNMKQMDGTPIIIPEGGMAPNGLVYIGDPDPVLGGTVPRGGVNKDLNNWSPRFGIAYSPEGGDGFLGKLLGKDKTVIRTGFGVYYGAIIGDTALQQLTATGFSKSEAYYYPSSGTLANPFGPDPFPNYATDEYDLNVGQNPNPFGLTGPVEVSAPLSQFARPIDAKIRTPYTYQYNMTIERSLGRNYVMTVSYVGNRSIKLYAQKQINYAYGTFLKAPAGRTIPTATSGNVNDRRVNTDVRLGLNQFSAAGSANYNALEMQLQRRFSKDLEFQASYTFSKSISDSDTSRDNLDLLDRSMTRSVSAQDIPHRFTGNWTYSIPFARNLPAAYKVFLDGWEFLGILTFQTGTPFTVNNSKDTTGTGGGINSLADLGSPFVQVENPRANGNRAFNIDAYGAVGTASTFVLSRDYRRGTSGVNQNRLKNGINNWDIVLAKKTPPVERIRRIGIAMGIVQCV